MQNEPPVAELPPTLPKLKSPKLTSYLIYISLRRLKGIKKIHSNSLQNIFQLWEANLYKKELFSYP